MAIYTQFQFPPTTQSQPRSVRRQLVAAPKSWIRAVNICGPRVLDSEAARRDPIGLGVCFSWFVEMTIMTIMMTGEPVCLPLRSTAERKERKEAWASGELSPIAASAAR